MAGPLCSSFTSDGKYFGSCGQDGKLKIWDTSTGILKQEFTPNLHLTTPFTCLTWIVTSRNHTLNVKKRKSGRNSYDDTGGTIDVAALGTTSGSITLYSVISGCVEGELLNGHSDRVNDLTWSRGTRLYSCGADKRIVEWNITSKSVASNWKSGKEQANCVVVLPDGKLLLSASSTITLWDLKTKEVKRTFTGHASPVISLALVSATSSNGDSYVISAARDDRLLNAWSLNSSKVPAASFLMEDAAASVSVVSGEDSVPTRMAAVTRSGVLHYYQHVLNGKCHTPLKPKLTVKIALDSGTDKVTSVTSIPFVHAQLNTEGNIFIVYGSASLVAIETISPLKHDKVLCLIRQDPRRLAISTVEAVSKVRVPETSEGVTYVLAATVPHGVKRAAKPREQSGVPLADRLQNLALTKPDAGSKTRHKHSMAQLLIQGLHSKEKKLLLNVLCHREPAIISSTVAQLPVQLVAPLVEELTQLIQKKTHVSTVAALWLKSVVGTHSGQLLAVSDVGTTFAGMLGVIETRQRLLPPLARLRGRLDLLVDQIDAGSKLAEQLEDQTLLYQEPDSSEDGSELGDMMFQGSETEEDPWDEQTESDEASEIEAQPNEIVSSE